MKIRKERGAFGIKTTIHCIGHSHIDPVFMWDWHEGYEAVRATFKTVLDLLDEYPEFTFTATSAALFAWIEEGDPAMFRAIQDKVRAGRWSLAGGWWVEPDCNMLHGESLVRQALYGQRYFRTRFGCTATVGMNPDTFGHAASIPQILAKSGCDSYFFMRPEHYEKTLPANVFWWTSPDGSRVLAVRLHSYLGPADDERLREIATNGHFGGSDKLFFYGVGNHGGGVTRASIDFLLDKQSDDDPDAPDLVFGTPEGFRDAVREARGIPAVSGELQHHARGCYSTVPELKRLNRSVEHALMAAERFATVAHAKLGASYPHASLEQAWKDALYLQFHDTLPGTCVPESVRDAHRQYGRALHQADEVLHYSVQRLAADIDTRGPGTPIAVFNPSLWERQDPVEMTVDIRHWGRVNASGSQYWWREGKVRLVDDQGIDVPVQLIPLTGYGASFSRIRLLFSPKMPALGFRVFQLLDEAAPLAGGDLRAEGTTLENRWWRLEVDQETGWVTRLVDKETGVDLLSEPGAVPVVMADASDTWAHEVRGFHQEVGRFAGAHVELIEHGPVRATLRVRSTCGDSDIDQQISLYEETPLIEWRVRVNWQERHKMLKIQFGFNIEAPTVVSDAPYGRIERPSDGEEQPGGQWLSFAGRARGEGGKQAQVRIALLNDSVQGYDVLARMRTYPWGEGRCVARLSLLRSPIYAFHEPNEPQEGVPYHYMSQGVHEFRIGLVPLSGGESMPADPVVAAESFNEPLITVNPTRQEGSLGASGSFAAVRGEHAAGVVLKRTEDDDGYLVRCYETQGWPGSVDIDLAFLGLSRHASLASGEIKSFIIPDARPSEVIECNLLEETT